MQPWPVINFGLHALLLLYTKSFVCTCRLVFVHYRICLLPLRDHRRLYVGDARGRIFSWTVSDNSGKIFIVIWVACVPSLATYT